MAKCGYLNSYLLYGGGCFWWLKIVIFQTLNVMDNSYLKLALEEGN